LRYRPTPGYMNSHFVKWRNKAVLVVPLAGGYTWGVMVMIARRS